ncbi:FecR family protein [Aquamicrobium sp. LC103]|uniref:FecR family protein n=1 Tax=Aquamicrobium sp. LC103 TaxID=1120658 RepID=UPI00063E9CAC|nr:FecR family protein [Aquamicrobium sp. LC103]TKT76337.1 FecR family protein [Aquamicrobium sp. LC103]
MTGVDRKADDEGQLEDAFTHDDPVVDEALEWFVRSRNASLDATTRAEFDAWLARSPRHAEEFRNLEAIWGSAAFGKAAESAHAGAHAAGEAARRVSPARRPTRWAMGMAAAAAVLVLAVGVRQFPTIMLYWQADYVTATGGQSTVILPDGSSMILNTASAVAVDFEDGRRNVRLLEGEAFFDVKNDPDRPFRVAGRFGEVEVKGTAFSVRSDDEQDRVVLERGRVEVSRLTDRTEQVALEPGQMTTATASALSVAMPVDAANALAWREGRAIFEDQPLANVLDELRRYHGGPVFVADGRIGNVAVSGNYRLDDVEGAIRTLADAVGAEAYGLPGGIIILR